jgi:AcrR family transcriptional regulator
VPQRNPAATRERIIAAAMRVFAEHGYFRAPVRLIALEAGVSKGLIFWHFRSKDEIIKEVALRALPHDVIKTCLDQGLHGCQLVECIAEKYLEKYSDDTRRRLLVHTLDIKNMYPPVEQLFQETCEKLLEEAGRRAFPNLPPAKSKTLARLLFGGLLCLTLSKPHHKTPREAVKEMLELLRPYCSPTARDNQTGRTAHRQPTIKDGETGYKHRS